MPSNDQTENRTVSASEDATQESNPMQQLERSIEILRAERKKHLGRIAEIDSYFERYGINIGEGSKPGKNNRKRGRPRKDSASKPASNSSRTNKRYDKSSTQFVMDFLRKRKDKSATTEELNKAFQHDRGASYHVSVVVKQLERDGYVRRTTIDGSRSKSVELLKESEQ